MDQAISYREVLKRLQDYEREEETDAQRKLVEKWKEHHPEAAKESSVALHPLDCLYTSNRIGSRYGQPKEADEEWHNDIYTVTVRFWSNDPVFGTDGGMIQLGISAIDGTARHDWREFQAIKNQIAGAECEAFELYPADSRLLDPSNYYTLWCFPGIKRLKVGINERRVLERDEAFAPQRKLP